MLEWLVVTERQPKTVMTMTGEHDPCCSLLSLMSTLLADPSLTEQHSVWSEREDTGAGWLADWRAGEMTDLMETLG